MQRNILDTSDPESKVESDIDSVPAVDAPMLEKIIFSDERPRLITPLGEDSFVFVRSYIYHVFDDNPLSSPYDCDSDILAVYNSNGEKTEKHLVMNKVEKIIPLSSEKFATQSSKTVQIWNTQLKLLKSMSIQDYYLRDIDFAQEQMIAFISDKHIVPPVRYLAELDFENNSFHNKIPLNYHQTSTAGTTIFIFQNKLVLFTKKDGCLYIHDLPLNENPPKCVEEINDLPDSNFEVYVWPQCGLLAIHEAHQAIRLWKLDENFKVTELPININAKWIARNPFPDGKLVFADESKVQIFNPINATCETLINFSEDDCGLITSLNVMGDGRIGIVKGFNVFDKNGGRTYTLELHHAHLPEIKNLWSQHLASQMEIECNDLVNVIGQYYPSSLSFFKNAKQTQPQIEIVKDGIENEQKSGRNLSL